MARPIANSVRVPLPRRVRQKAETIARSWDVTLQEFLRQCIEGRVNQIMASRETAKR